MNERSIKGDKTRKHFRITRKVTELKTLTGTMDIVMKQLETFSVHNYTNIIQLHKFQCQENNLNPGEIIISEDLVKKHQLNIKRKL